MSVGGFTGQEIEDVLSQLGMDVTMPHLATAVLSDLGIEQLSASVGPKGVEVVDDKGRWAKVCWSEKSRQAVYEILPLVGELTGADVSLDPTVKDLIEKVGTSIEVHAKVWVANQSREGTATLRFKEPLLAEFSREGRLSLGGIPMGAVDPTPFRPFMPMTVGWDGGRRELRATVKGDTPMPYVFIQEGALPKVGEMYILKDEPWSKAESLLQNMEISFVVTAEGQRAPKANLDYAAAPGPAPSVRLVPKIAADPQGHVGVLDPPMRISDILAIMGLDIEDVLGPVIAAYGKPGTTIGFRVNRSAVSVELDEAPIGGIRWDAELRRNLMETLPISPLPFGADKLFPDWKVTLAEFLVRTEWGLQIAVKEEIRPNPLSPYLSRLGPWIRVFGK